MEIRRKEDSTWRRKRGEREGWEAGITWNSRGPKECNKNGK